MDGEPKRASEHDRDYFRRLGEWERENDELATAAHLALPILERINVAWRMWQELGPFVMPEPDDGANEAFYARARELGLSGLGSLGYIGRRSFQIAPLSRRRMSVPNEGSPGRASRRNGRQ